MYGDSLRKKNCFRWPVKQDVLRYSNKDILCKLTAPVPINHRGDLRLSDEDFTKACEILLNLQ